MVLSWLWSKVASGTNIMSYDTPSVMGSLRNGFSGSHLELLPEGHAGRRQVEDDMGANALSCLERHLQEAPRGTVWYVARTFKHAAGWSVHSAVAIQAAGNILLFDLDGADGDDWSEGPSLFRYDLPFLEFFKGVTGEGDDDIMSFTEAEHFCMFVPICTKDNHDVREAASSLRSRPEFATYHYKKCNCHKYAVEVFNEMCDGVPEILSLVMHHIIPKMHRTMLSEDELTFLYGGIGALCTIIGDPLLALPLIYAGIAGTAATGSENMEALPGPPQKVRRTDRLSFPVYTLQYD